MGQKAYRTALFSLHTTILSMSKSKRSRNPDHVRRLNRPSPPNQVIEERIKSLLSSAVLSQGTYYRGLGLRDRLLNLPVMVASVLMLLWRQVPSLHELTRMLAREDLFWRGPVQVSQQALDKRFLSFPAVLFERIFFAILPRLRQRALERTRPLAKSVQQAKTCFDQIYVVDGSTLEALFRKLKTLQDSTRERLAGKIVTVVDLVTRLPVQLWFTTAPHRHDTNYTAEILALSKPGTLWLFDRGFYDFTFFYALIDQGAGFITRLKANAVFTLEQPLLSSDQVRDQVIRLRDGKHPLRLIEIRYGTKWYRYVTSVCDPTQLSAQAVADLYRRRWRIEEAFLTVKRLLGLSYLWTGSENGVLLQVWATWLFFGVLVDLGDEVAEALMVPFDRISLEMVFRGLYHFMRAYERGAATDPVAYLSAPENRDLGVVKRKRRKRRAHEPDKPDENRDLLALDSL